MMCRLESGQVRDMGVLLSIGYATNQWNASGKRLLQSL
jgi:hypothetical protein